MLMKILNYLIFIVFVVFLYIIVPKNEEKK
jgi:hypothetical protein